jgi:hypothetical protein
MRDPGGGSYAAELSGLLDEQNARAGSPRRQRGWNAARPAAADDHIVMTEDRKIFGIMWFGFHGKESRWLMVFWVFCP